jgi:hypothetical protein
VNFNTSSVAGTFSQNEYSETKWLGDPAKIEDRTFSSTSPGYHDNVNLAGDKDGGSGVAAPTLYKPASFMDASGRSDNQSTDRGVR